MGIKSGVWALLAVLYAIMLAALAAGVRYQMRSRTGKAGAGAWRKKSKRVRKKEHPYR